MLIRVKKEQINSDEPNPLQEEEDKKELSKERATVVTLWGVVVLLFGSFAILLSETFLDKTNILVYVALHGLSEFLRDLGIALMSAGIIGILIEIQDIVEFAEKTLVRAMTSKLYLATLDKGKLEKLKNQCSEYILRSMGNRVENNLNESLLKLENSISSLITEPYYEYINQYIVCEHKNLKSIPEFGLSNDCFVIQKTVRTNFKIVSPKDGPDTETISWATNLFFPPGLKNEEGMQKITKFIYIADNDGEKDITQDVVYADIGTGKSMHPKYNKNFRIQKKTGEVLTIPYKNELFVQIEESRNVPETDYLHSAKLNKPCKNLTIQYFYPNPNVMLKCEYFGTLRSTQQELTLNESEQMVTIESRKWLLPGNGFLIGHLPK